MCACPCARACIHVCLHVRYWCASRPKSRHVHTCAYVHVCGNVLKQTKCMHVDVCIHARWHASTLKCTKDAVGERHEVNPAIALCPPQSAAKHYIQSHSPLAGVRPMLCVVLDLGLCSAGPQRGHAAVLKRERDHLTRLAYRQQLSRNIQHAEPSDL